MQIGLCMPKFHWSDADAVAFGTELARTLWPGRDIETLDAKSEIGCFAKFYQQARARDPTSVGNGFTEMCLAKARHVAKHGKSARSKGAVLLKILRDKVKVT